MVSIGTNVGIYQLLRWFRFVFFFVYHLVFYDQSDDLVVPVNLIPGSTHTRVHYTNIVNLMCVNLHLRLAVRLG